MGKERGDGSIQSANLPIHSNMAKYRVDKDFSIYRCMVMKVNFVGGDNTTFENKQVTYDVVILGGPKEGQIIPNAKSMNLLGGKYNYSERIWTPMNTDDPSSKPLSEHTGDIVFVGFLQGNSRVPVILGGGVQPQDIDFTGATEEDGVRWIQQFNGVFENINSEGEYLFTRKGVTKNFLTGEIVPTEEPSFEAKLQFLKDKISLEDPNSSILIEKTSQKMTTKVGLSGFSEEIDGISQTISQKIGGITVNYDGTAQTFNAKVGVSNLNINGATNKITLDCNTTKAEIDGTSNKITLQAGSATIMIDGLTSKITLQSGFVDLGQTASDFVVLFTELLSQFATHTHLGNLGAPTSPPLLPLLPTVGSLSVKAQA